MIEERTKIKRGSKPVVIIAPHGYDDKYTAELADEIISIEPYYGVINYGWRRSPLCCHKNSLANCNNVKHIHEDVVKEEFLDPIINFCNKIQQPNIFIIHGFQESANKIVLGQGDAKSYSCSTEFKDKFGAEILRKTKWIVEDNNPIYAGAGKNNLNQLFRKHYPNKETFSIQLEISTELRKDYKNTAKHLVEAIRETIKIR